MKLKEPGHDCLRIGCHVSLDGEAIVPVEIYDGLTGKLLATVIKGDALPVMPLKNREVDERGWEVQTYKQYMLTWPKLYRGTRPYTRKVA